MKTINPLHSYLLIIFLLATTNINAQLSGIGIFKINKTTTDIIDTINVSIKDFYATVDVNKEPTIRMGNVNPVDFMGNDVVIKELKKDLNNRYTVSEAFLLNSVRVFYIGYYNVSSIPITDLYLTFFNDTLIQFKCNYTDQFAEALTLKYGKPIIKSKQKEIVCQNGFGAIARHTEYSEYPNWNTKIKNISAKGMHLLWYSSEGCKPMFLNEFVLKDEF